MELNKQHTRFYKSKANLEAGLARFDFDRFRPLMVETVDGWTAIFNGVSVHNAGGQPIWMAQRGFTTI
jgi:hypothetical protein